MVGMGIVGFVFSSNIKQSREKAAYKCIVVGFVKRKQQAQWTSRGSDEKKDSWVVKSYTSSILVRLIPEPYP